MNKKQVLLIGLAASLLCLLCACKKQTEGAAAIDVSSTVEEEQMDLNYELTQRQVEILKELELPTTYEELTFGQRISIESIESMLAYLEGKYDDTFTYEGYYPSDFGADEHLTANCSLGLVTVYRTYEGKTPVYTDNYIELQLTPEYENDLSCWFSEKLGVDALYVEADLSSANAGEGNILGRASASALVAFEVEDVPADTLGNLAQDFAAWAAPQLSGHACSLTLFSLKPGVLATLSRNNSEETLLGGNIAGHIICSISEDGTINIH